MKLLKKVLQHLQTIQGSRKGSIGTMHNVYLPQLKRKFVDDLATEVSDYLANEGPGIELMRAERRRHITEEGFDADHDSRHENDELSWAAICYAAPGPMVARGDLTISDGRDGDTECFCRPFVIPYDPWPWDTLYDKRRKHSRLKKLIIAGALIAAEIDRTLALEPDVKE